MEGIKKMKRVAFPRIGKDYTRILTEMLEELGLMISSTNLSNGLFHANHASNYLPIRAKLPEEKKKTLELISQALQGNIELKPEFMRAL